MRKIYSVILVTLCATILIYLYNVQREVISPPDPAPDISYVLGNSLTEEIPVPFDHYAAEKPKRTLIRVLEESAPKPQQFIITPSAISTITCTNGTVLQFDPGIFQYSDTKLAVTEEIKISVTEYLSTSDILFKGLTTTSNNKLIETAGMVYITASSMGKNCEIKSGEYFRIEIPAEKEKTGMELFYGEEKSDGINWIAANKGNLMKIDAQSYYGRLNETSFPKGSPRFENGMIGLYQYLHSQFIFPEGFDQAEKECAINLKATSYVNFTLDYEGQPRKVYTSSHMRTYADSQLISAFQNSPCWKVRLNKHEGVIMMIPVKMEWVRDPKSMPAKTWISDKPSGEQFTAAYQADRYLMVSAKLGWLNCDKYINASSSPEKLFVAIDSIYDASVRIVFRDINGIVSGVRYANGFEFQNLPKGKNATLVVMRIVDGKTEIAIRDYFIDGSNVENLVFKTANGAELRRQFELIGRNDELVMRE